MNGLGGYDLSAPVNVRNTHQIGHTTRYSLNVTDIDGTPKNSNNGNNGNKIRRSSANDTLNNESNITNITNVTKHNNSTNNNNNINDSMTDGEARISIVNSIDILDNDWNFSDEDEDYIEYITKDSKKKLEELEKW